MHLGGSKGLQLFVHDGDQLGPLVAVALLEKPKDFSHFARSVAQDIAHNHVPDVARVYQISKKMALFAGERRLNI